MHHSDAQNINSIKYTMIWRFLLCFTLLWANCGEGFAQSIYMVNGETQTVNLCTSGIDIYDDGGPNGNYSNYFNGEVDLITAPGANIILTGSYYTESTYDHITIYDGNAQLQYCTGSGTVNLTATSGLMRIVFHTDLSVTRSGFEFHASTPAIPSQCHLTVNNFSINNLNSTSGILTWEGTGTNLMLNYGTGPIPVTGNSYPLTGLTGNTDYTVILYEQVDSGEVCCSASLRFRTPLQGGHGCIDPTDLTAPYVQGYYGSFGNPYSTLGIVDNGPSNAYSRHTIHTDVNERDPRTGNQLRTIPPGGSSSVRLGNWRTGSEAEAILYAIDVDTMVADLLILKYAAVLENPSHTPSEQPRFRLEILNGNMEVIDPVCGMADFISNANLGWNSYGSTLWKDWTTVGIDLTPYAGQTIQVRLTTYDCSQSGHYGYAYFTLECSRKNMTSESCGNNMNNTFTVPAGFNYLWYTDSPSNPISTSRSLNVTNTTSTIYHCLLSFVDKPQCNFTMSAFAGVRYPLSLFDTLMTVNNCQFDVSFLNRSTISADGVTPSGSGESCETAWWDFGNGDTSNLYHASTHYDHPGTYTVTLVSTIANGMCADTLQEEINILPPGPNPVIIGPMNHCEGDLTPDTLHIENAAWSSAPGNTMIVNPTSTTTYTVTATDSSDCPYTLNHTITLRPSYHRQDSSIICTTELPFSYGSLVISNAIDTGSYSYQTTTIYGCDSIGTVFLTVNDTNSADTLAVACDSFNWYGTTYTTSGAVASRVTTNAGGCDSTTTLRLTIHQSSSSIYYDTVVENNLPRLFNNTLFSDSISHTPVTIPNAVLCDSTIDYSLYVHWNQYITLCDTVCNNQLPRVWNGMTFDTTLAVSAVMTHVATIPAHTGADSIITMRLTVHPLYDHHIYPDICDNQQYAFGDSIFLGSNGTTLHLDSLLSIHGCDSLSTLHLTVHPTFDHHVYDTVCTNHTYTWGTPQRSIFTPGSVTQQLHGSDTTAHFSIFNSLFVVDTLVIDHLSSVHSCDSLSSLHLHLLPAYDLHFFDTICSNVYTSTNGQWTPLSYTFENASYSTTASHPHSFSTVAPYICDSIRTLHLKVYPSYDLHLYDTIYDGDTYHFENTLYDTTGTYPHLFSAVFLCDSLRTLHLQRNRRTYNDSTLCQNALPLVWNGSIFSDGGGTRHGHWQTFKDSVHLVGLNGIDSLVVMTVIAKDTSSSVDHLHSCDSLLWRNNIIYNSSTSTPFVTLQNFLGCDSIRHLDLTIDHTHFYSDRINACDSMQWIDNRWYFRDTLGFAGPVGSHLATGPVDTLVTKGGCDSVVALDLRVHYATYEETIDTFCSEQTYLWRQFSIHSDTLFTTTDYYLTDTLLSVHHCDSVLAIRLTQMAKPSITFSYDHDCAHLSYLLTGTTDVNYLHWSSFPHDPLLDDHERDALVIVSPQVPTDYILYADYHETPLCPASDQITLYPITIPEAVLQVNPEALEYNAMDYDAYDASLQYVDRTWYIDWIEQDELSRHLHGQGPIDQDSLVIALSVYNGQCYDTAIRVLPILRVLVLAPNVFTPGLDNNNRFTVTVDGVIDGELFIYNRKGELVFRTTDFQHQGWDGRNCPQGNYVWKLFYHAIDYPTVLKSTVGSILLLR